MKPTTLEELTKELNKQKQAYERTHRELTLITSATNILFGADGNPTPESLESMDKKILNLLRNYAAQPTLLEASSLVNLGENAVQGASFSVGAIIGPVVFIPAAQIVPVLGGVVPQLYQFILSSASSEGGVSVNTLFNEVTSKIVVKAKDEKTGADLLNAQEQFHIDEQIKVLLSVLLEISLHQQVISATEDGIVSITILGNRVHAHMVALDQWMKDISSAQRQLGSAGNLLLP